jgi:hypothetical protein
MPRNLYERVEVLFPLKDSENCERVCTEILSSYLADTRNSRPRSVRKGHGFSVQEHLMRLATGSLDHHGKTAPHGPGVVYTSKEVTAEPASPEADTTAQDSANAAV